tara:strand:+ start:2340 stop:2603 length:264 start_codon:yes stop_codon:yes gene_type:complete
MLNVDVCSFQIAPHQFFRKEKIMEKPLKDIISILDSLVKRNHEQQELNSEIYKAVKTLQDRVILLEGQNHVMDTVARITGNLDETRD